MVTLIFHGHLISPQMRTAVRVHDLSCEFVASRGERIESYPADFAFDVSLEWWHAREDGAERAADLGGNLGGHLRDDLGGNLECRGNLACNLGGSSGGPSNIQRRQH